MLGFFIRVCCAHPFLKLLQPPCWPGVDPGLATRLSATYDSWNAR